MKNFFNSSFVWGLRNNWILKTWQNQYVISVKWEMWKISLCWVQAATNIHVIITWNEHSWYLLHVDESCGVKGQTFSRGSQFNNSRFSLLSLYDYRKEWRHSSLSLDLDLIKLITLSSSGKIKQVLIALRNNLFMFACHWSNLHVDEARGCGLDFCWYLLTYDWYF